MEWDNFIARTLWLILQPSNLFFLCLIFSVFCLWRSKTKTGISILSICVLFYGLVMFGPLTVWVLNPLESRFHKYTNVTDQGPYSGIIILAGAERLNYSTYHNQVTLNGAAERLISAAKLARKFPELPIIFSGGGTDEGLLKETEIAQKFFKEAGIKLDRVRFEDKSYNTFTNAKESKKLITQEETNKWFLVTSAFHMPRAVGAFRAAKIKIQPYPVDYRSSPLQKIKLDAGRNLYELDYAVHEWVGLVAYYFRNQSDVLFPSPDETT